MLVIFNTFYRELPTFLPLKPFKYNLAYSNLPMTVSVNALNINLKDINFSLNIVFLSQWRMKKPKFGFNGVGEFTYMRSYSRMKEDGTKETWFDTVKRVVEGTYKIQKLHILQNGLHWDDKKAQQSAQTMFKYIFDMKFLPPGRGLWAMGTPIIEEKGLFEALNNCAFTSTEYIDKDFLEPFLFMMDASMLGIGVGFNVKGAGQRIIYRPLDDSELTPPAYKIRPFVIPDSREGFVEALRLLLESYSKPLQKKVLFDYSEIRDRGIPLKTFGGVASGYKPLEMMIERIRKILDPLHGKPITETAIADIMNIIGDCVVAGGIRRTAQISFGNSDEFMNLKNNVVNKYRSAWMHRSNNSIDATVGQKYDKYVPLISVNGEPGFFWSENAKEFGRMGRNSHELPCVDHRACGGNPCLEQTLEHMEMCCLVETFPNSCEDLDEFLDVLKYAYLYAKTVTLGRTHWEKTNRVMLRNRRIGTSVTGVAQFIENKGISQLREWLDMGYSCIRDYDRRYSEWFAIPESIKVTSVKPSGTISLLAGATAGIHYPVSRYFIRHIRVSSSDPIVDYARKIGLEVEPEWKKNESGEWEHNPFTSVVKFYVDVGAETRKQSIWEQLELAAFMQENWSDNQVSVSVYFDPETESEDLARALDFYQYRLKGVSIFPRIPLEGEYRQIPFQVITKEEYMINRQELNFVRMDNLLFNSNPEADKYCTTDTCEIDLT